MIETLAGILKPSSNADGVPAIWAGLNSPSGLAADNKGNLYVADEADYRVRRIDPDGIISTIAGTGERGFSGDGGPATHAELEGPSSLALDGVGTLYVAESHYHRVRKIDPDGIISTVVGAGMPGFSGDGGLGTEALLDSPAGLAADGSGNLFVSDRGNHRIRRVGPDGVITTVAGRGRCGKVGDGGPATEAYLWHPAGLAADRIGNLFVSDSSNHRVLRIDRDGMIETIAGRGYGSLLGDGRPATEASLLLPDALALDSSGNLYVGDGDDHRVRKIDPTGRIWTVAGNGTIGSGGDGGPASEACIYRPAGLAVDAEGNLFIADDGNQNVRVVKLKRLVTVELGRTGKRIDFARTPSGTLARGGRFYTEGSEFRDGVEPYVLRTRPDGVVEAIQPRRAQDLRLPGGRVLRLAAREDDEWKIGPRTVRNGDRHVEGGTEYFLELVGGRWRLAEYRIWTVSGRPDPVRCAPTPATDIEEPTDVAVDASGNLYVAEFGGDRVLRVAPDGSVATAVEAGADRATQTSDASGSLELRCPEHLEIDTDGNLYVVERSRRGIWRIATDGSVSKVTVKGPRRLGSGRDGDAAKSAMFPIVGGIADDGAGNIYVSDKYGHRVQRIDPDGWISTIAGIGAPGFDGDGGPASQAVMDSPTALASDRAGALYVADSGNARIRRIDRDGIIDTVAGSDEKIIAAEGVPAIEAHLQRPRGLATDRAGNVYVVEHAGQRIRKIDPSGTITNLAGTGKRGGAGDGGPASAAELYWPDGIAADRNGNLYVAELVGHRVRQIDPNGRISTVAGRGKRGFEGDGGPAVAAKLFRPQGVAVDKSGAVFVADSGNHRVRRIDPEGRISTLAGTGEAGYGGDGCPAAEAELNEPCGIAADGAGSVYVCDSKNHRIRRIDAKGMIATVAGTGTPGHGGDGGPAIEAMLHWPALVATDERGNVYVGDRNNERVRKIDADGIITTVVGTGQPGYAGDRGPADRAQLSQPSGVAVDGAGNLYVADTENGRVRRIDSAGTITTFAGGGSALHNGDRGPADKARIGTVHGLSVDASGNVYFSDSFHHRVRRFLPGGRITTIAGTGKAGYAGDGGAAHEAQISHPTGVAADANGNVYVADTGNQRVRRISASGLITTTIGTGRERVLFKGGPPAKGGLRSFTAIAADGPRGFVVIARNRVWRIGQDGEATPIAGSGDRGHAGDGGPAIEASLDRPASLAVDGAGNVYVAEMHRVRRIDSAGVITTLAGTGERGQGWQHPEWPKGDPAYPTDVATDANGNVYFADRERHRIRRIDFYGEISTFAGTGELGELGDGGPAAAACFEEPAGLAVGSDGSVYVADSCHNRVRRIDWDGTISTFAGTGEAGFGGDGGPALLAKLWRPVGVATDGAGNVYISDLLNSRIRRVGSDGVIETIAGKGEEGFAGDGGPALLAEFREPTAVAVDAAGSVYVADSGNDRIRRIDADGTITTLAGIAGQAASEEGAPNSADDGSPAGRLRLNGPGGVATDAAGNVFVADTFNHRVLVIDSRGGITTLAGGDQAGLHGDGGPANQAGLNCPSGVAVDSSGNVLIADKNNLAVRRVDPEGILTSVHLTSTYGGDDGLATEAAFVGPLGLAADWHGNVYVADAGDHRVRKINPSGTITAFAGTGEQGFEGDTGPARAARFDRPSSVTLDGAGNVYVADASGQRIRKIDAAGTVGSMGGTGASGFSGDGGPATEASLTAKDIAADEGGNLYMADGLRVRRIDALGDITTIAGTGSMAFGREGGPAAAAGLSAVGIAVGEGGIWFVDLVNQRIRALQRYSY